MLQSTPYTANKRTSTIHIFVIFCMLFMLSACASQKASLKAPELPPRHWLDEAPGVPVENKDKLAAAVPNLYDPNKVFTFEDCVFLTIQQSPLLVNSAVDLEIKKLQLTDAVWQYLPQPRMTLTASSNLTHYNMGNRYVSSKYGQPAFRVGFYAAFPNPVYTYFNHQVQKIMVSLAISAHRKAIGAAIRDIADIFMKLDAKKKIIEQQKSLLPLHKQLIDYWREVESVEGRQGVSLSVARQRQRQAELTVERSSMEETMLLTRLKILAGVDTHQKLQLNVDNSVDILQDFDGKKLTWESRWPATEDELMIRSQVKLQDYNIIVAWAKYIPDMTIQLNTYPPAGQAQPPNGTEDTFLHLNFDFPLLDWGSRYRGVQQARMGKAKAYHEQGRKRNDYANRWLEAQQQTELSLTSLKISKNNLDVAEMEYKEAQINFNEGLTAFPALASKQEALTTARINYIQAELDLNIARLTWMQVANVLPERYLGLPAKEIF